MADSPQKPAEVRRIIRRILESGLVSYSGHALSEMKNDGLETTDCVNVLRGGVVEPPDLHKGTWRYRVSTGRMCFVITLPDPDTVRVVTAWRDK